MRIFHAITSLDKGGAENHVAILSNEQMKYKNEVFIFISKNSTYWSNFLKKKNIKIFKSNHFNEENFLNRLIKFVKDINYLIKLLNKYKPDVLHAHLPYMEIVTFISMFFLNYKPKFIITKHVDSDFFRGSRDQNKTLYGSIISKIISLKSQKVIAISYAVKNFFVDNYFSIKNEKIKVIYYGLDNLDILSRKNKKIILNSKNKKNTLVIGCIARLVPQKSIDNLINSLLFIKDLDIKLIIIGKGPLEKKLKNYAKKMNLESKILWIKFIDDLKNFYKFIDIFVLTSKFEGLGLVFLEAMLSKKPVISSNSSAMREIIKNDFNGYLVKLDDPISLSKAILKLKNQKIRQRFGINGYNFVKKKFSITKMYNETQKTYLNK